MNETIVCPACAGSMHLTHGENQTTLDGKIIRECIYVCDNEHKLTTGVFRNV